VNGSTKESTPLSPGAESREKELFSLLLSINGELLYESIQLQNTRAELKKEMKREQSAAAEAGGSTNGEVASMVEEDKLIQQDYAQSVYSLPSRGVTLLIMWFSCMRRLQGNLTFLASLADRKGAAQIPQGPPYLAPPPLNLRIKMRSPTTSTAPDSSDKQPDPDPGREEEDQQLMADREDRDKLLKELYKKLQAQFPGVDPRKEPAFPHPAKQQPQNGQRPGVPGTGHSSNQGSPAPTPQA
jgi:hypothetical protein